MRRFLLVGLTTAVIFAEATAASPIRLASSPALSPDGKRLAFAWAGDIYTVATSGGNVRQLTHAPSDETTPVFSPDGKQLAFVSDRTGSNQIFIMRATGGDSAQLTHHTEGYALQDWFPNNKSLLVSGSRDHFWREPQRFFRVNIEPQIVAQPQMPRQNSAEQLLFDAYGEDGRLAADGTQLLFTREGERWWRKGYRGSRASQIWKFDFETRQYGKLIRRETESRSPIWMPDGTGFYYVGGQGGNMNLWSFDLTTRQEEQLTHFEDDSVISPCISRDGSTIVFRHLFDLYRLRPEEGPQPQRINLLFQGDQPRAPTERRTLDSATEVAFSKDGLEIAFIAGGDLWVMDTELREPIQLTNTPEEERSPLFSPDNAMLLYVSDAGGQSDIWSAERHDAKRYWWQNEKFVMKKLTDDAATEFGLQWSPAGDQIAYLRERGDLWVMKPDGAEPRRILQSWSAPNFDWSPDGKWLVYAASDAEFNRDIFVVPLDNSLAPFNLSRHPDNDDSPKWSPDGKVIAFTGRRVGDDVDINFVYLQAGDSEASARDRRIEKAIEKIEKVRKSPAGKQESAETAKRETSEKSEGGKPADGDTPPDQSAAAAAKKDEASANAAKLPEVRIDFDGIADRLRRVSIANANETGLFWSHDSKKLAFTTTIAGKQGTYTISPPDELSPKLLSTETGRHARWVSQGNQIVWLASGKPASLSATGSSTPFAFSAKQVVDIAARHEAAFDQCWRAMRDHFYDGALNNRNWDEIRRKYRAVARESGDSSSLTRVISLMLGELNASHLGFTPARIENESSAAWRETTAHLGVRFEYEYKGPGLKIRDVLPDGPASRVKSKLEAGEIILSIDGQTIDPAQDLSPILNGLLARDIKLRVRNAEKAERDVTLRPISYATARLLLYEKWIDDNQQAVDTASAGKLGYLHISGMNMTSFYRFEQELYSVGAGKEGIIIDVRENGGGSTTDHLLTILTQPKHAVTVPRGGEAGYPHDRSVYATWRKPVVVLCNQNSFSNAEIFSHAIKTLKRGKLVGVPTAGGVISTGSLRIMEMGTLRMPFRGWFVLGTGEDMELNGAVPHHTIWPQPGELPQGIDKQLNKAIQVLELEVKRWQQRPQPVLRKNSARE